MEKYEKLVARIKEKKSVAIAFSGGADSGLVAKAAVDAGLPAIAITIVSPLLARRHIEDAKNVADEIGIEHIFIRKELSRDVRENGRKRCYYCKKEDAMLLKKYALDNGYETVADGITASDDYIGKKALDEEGIWHPLVELEIKKEEVRSILKRIGMSFWNKPSDSCLATRIPYGTFIEESLLKKIDEAEDFLLNFFNVVRVRAHGDIARIEVGKDEIKKVFGAGENIVKKIKKLGFKYVVVDLEGYRKGSMKKI